MYKYNSTPRVLVGVISAAQRFSKKYALNQEGADMSVTKSDGTTYVAKSITQEEISQLLEYSPDFKRFFDVVEPKKMGATQLPTNLSGELTKKL